MDIRRLNSDDVDVLQAAVRRLLEPADGDELSIGEDLASALADSRCYFLVCEKDAVPVGYLSAFRFPTVEWSGQMVYLYDLVVDADRRREGIGTMLVEALKDLCRADGVTRVWAGTAIENQAAQRTFERTGARRVSETYVEYVYNLTG